MGEWFRNELKSVLYETLSRKKIEEKGIFSYNYIDSLVNDHMKERSDYSTQIWSLFVFELWYNAYMKGAEH